MSKWMKKDYEWKTSLLGYYPLFCQLFFFFFLVIMSSHLLYRTPYIPRPLSTSSSDLKWNLRNLTERSLTLWWICRDTFSVDESEAIFEKRLFSVLGSYFIHNVPVWLWSEQIQSRIKGKGRWTILVQESMANYPCSDSSLFLSLRFASSIDTEYSQISFCYGVSR